MPLAAEDFIQENSGTVTTGGTSCVVSLPSGTTAGNTLVVVITCAVAPSGVPAGFVADKQLSTVLHVYRKSDVGGAETSWTFTTSSSTAFTWYVAELSGVDPVEPLDASANSSAGVALSNNSTLSTGTTPLNAALHTVVLAAFSVTTTAANVQSWSGWTNEFEELLDVTASGAYPLAVARKFVSGVTGQFETTATLAATGACNGQALIVAYRAADSPIVAPLAHIMGFEFGTHGGFTASASPYSSGLLGLPSTPMNPTGTWGTSYLVQAASARNSGFGLRIVAAGAGAAVRTGSIASAAASVGFDVRVVSATGTVDVAYVGTSTGSALAMLVYDSSTNKFGVRAKSTGTISWQSGTTALNTWVWVDIRVKVNTSTWRAEWRLETDPGSYTDQAAAELGGQSPATAALVGLGSDAVATVTADFDNVVLSNSYVAYPLGPHQVRLLTVDPAGTPTVSGTSSNFSVFTANGTLGAWNATNARNAVDEVPPTVSASADGVVQTATAASDYIEFPMAAPTLAADEIIDGVRMLAAMWDGAGAGTGTVGIRSWDGTTETTLIAASTSFDAGSPTAISSTEPYWQCAMWPMPNGWTEAKLAAAALRFGFSTDAAPDKGTDAMYVEYATRRARLEQVFGSLVSAEVNPNTGGIRSVTVDTAVESGKAADLVYEESGTPTTVSVPADTSQTETLDAPDAPTINRIELHPDPES